MFGKIGNIFHRSDLATELAGVADRIVTKAIDEQVAAEIDREAAAAKESLPSS